MNELEPVNILEIELKKAQAGVASMAEFIHLLVKSDIFVPSASEIMPDGSGFQPTLFFKEGVPMVACFSSLDMMRVLSEKALYCLTIKGGEFLSRFPADHGFVMNPGYTLGFDISPSGIRKIVEELSNSFK